MTLQKTIETEKKNVMILLESHLSASAELKLLLQFQIKAKIVTASCF